LSDERLLLRACLGSTGLWDDWLRDDWLRLILMLLRCGEPCLLSAGLWDDWLLRLLP
jgi:hypothetical protein